MNIALFSIAILYALAGAITYQIFRRSKLIAWFFFGVTPVLLSFWWLTRESSHDWFMWAKLYSITLLSCLTLKTRDSNSKHQKIFFSLIYALTVINISQASLRSLINAKSIPLILIGVAGILLIITLPSSKYLSIKQNKLSDCLWDLPFSYIWGYTIWDFAFIFLAFPELMVIQLVLLITPLLIIGTQRKLYYQARVFTLAFYMLGAFIFPETTKALTITPWGNELFAWILSVSILVYLTFFFFLDCLKKRTKT